MKEGCLFVLFVLIRSNIPVLGLFGKLSRRRGALARFQGVWTCGAKVIEYIE
jgi:hypothetical protein